MRAFLEDSIRHALRALSDEKARASRSICAFGKDVGARETRHDTDMAGLDRDVIVELDVVGKGIYAVAASAENVADDALEGIVASDYLAGGKVLAELPHEDAELPCGNVHRAEVLPLPCPRIAEVAAFRQHIRLYALVFGPGRENRLWREVLPCLLHQDCDLPVLGLNAPPPPYPRRERDERNRNNYCNGFHVLSFAVYYTKLPPLLSEVWYNSGVPRERGYGAKGRNPMR